MQFDCILINTYNLNNFIFMMKKVFFALALTIILAACSSDSYKLSGKFNDVTTGTVYLKKITEFGIEDVDTTELVNGAFTFEGSVEHPELYLIFHGTNRVPIALFLENTNITITGSTAEMEAVEIKGSRLNNLFKKFNDEIPHSEKVERMREEFFMAQSSGDQSTMESIMADMQVIIEEQQNYYRNFVKENSNNVVGAFLALNMAQGLEVEELEEILEKLEANLSGHPYVVQLQEFLTPMQTQRAAEAALSVGNEAPVFTLKDIEGNAVSLDQYRGKYVFLDFWAAWCRPCRIENPILKRAYDRFGGDEFEIVSVSLDETTEAWKKAVEEDQLNWVLLHDPMGSVAQTYAVQSIPNTWLLDRDGNIMHKQLRGEELIEVLEGLLN
ncbi:Peroxiredoxin [Alkalitalea saponilacus]|uniref:Peroxiredoxin n=2 Tax=Alkalitalea saponilacus TaxID=889453 RepID=A0A1T5HF17_9BACT|nr:Peroxiredoxin [Alkalitalea saponilacus]